VIPLAVRPARLFWGEPFSGLFRRYKPVLLIVSGSQLFEQDSPQRRGFLLLGES